MHAASLSTLAHVSAGCCMPQQRHLGNLTQAYATAHCGAGYKAAGDAAALRQLAGAAGLEVSIVELVGAGEPGAVGVVSSTKVCVCVCVCCWGPPAAVCMVGLGGTPGWLQGPCVSSHCSTPCLRLWQGQLYRPSPQRLPPTLPTVGFLSTAAANRVVATVPCTQAIVQGC
jgi:hypothetical protein